MTATVSSPQKQQKSKSTVKKRSRIDRQKTAAEKVFSSMSIGFSRQDICQIGRIPKKSKVPKPTEEPAITNSSAVSKIPVIREPTKEQTSSNQNSTKTATKTLSELVRSMRSLPKLPKNEPYSDEETTGRFESDTSKTFLLKTEAMPKCNVHTYSKADKDADTIHNSVKSVSKPVSDSITLHDVASETEWGSIPFEKVFPKPTGELATEKPPKRNQMSPDLERIAMKICSPVSVKLVKIDDSLSPQLKKQLLKSPAKKSKTKIVEIHSREKVNAVDKFDEIRMEKMDCSDEEELPHMDIGDDNDYRSGHDFPVLSEKGDGFDMLGSISDSGNMQRLIMHTVSSVKTESPNTGLSLHDPAKGLHDDKLSRPSCEGLETIPWMKSVLNREVKGDVIPGLGDLDEIGKTAPLFKAGNKYERTVIKTSTKIKICVCGIEVDMPLGKDELQIEDIVKLSLHRTAMFGDLMSEKDLLLCRSVNHVLHHPRSTSTGRKIFKEYDPSKQYSYLIRMDTGKQNQDKSQPDVTTEIEKIIQTKRITVPLTQNTDKPTIIDKIRSSIDSDKSEVLTDSTNLKKEKINTYKAGVKLKKDRESSESTDLDEADVEEEQIIQEHQKMIDGILRKKTRKKTRWDEEWKEEHVENVQQISTSEKGKPDRSRENTPSRSIDKEENTGTSNNGEKNISQEHERHSSISAELEKISRRYKFGSKERSAERDRRSGSKETSVERVKRESSDKETSQVHKRRSGSKETSLERVKRYSSDRETTHDQNRRSGSKESSNVQNRRSGSKETSLERVKRDSSDRQTSQDRNRRSGSKESSQDQNNRRSGSKETSLERVKRYSSDRETTHDSNRRSGSIESSLKRVKRDSSDKKTTHDRNRRSGSKESSKVQNRRSGSKETSLERVKRYSSDRETTHDRSRRSGSKESSKVQNRRSGSKDTLLERAKKDSSDRETLKDRNRKFCSNESSQAQNNRRSDSKETLLGHAKRDSSDGETSQERTRRSGSKESLLKRVKKDSSDRETSQDLNRKSGCKESLQVQNRRSGSKETSVECVERESSDRETSQERTRRSGSKETSLERAKSDLSDRETPQDCDKRSGSKEYSQRQNNRRSGSKETSLERVKRDSSDRQTSQDRNRRSGSKESSQDQNNRRSGSKEISLERVKRESSNRETSQDCNRRFGSKESSHGQNRSSGSKETSLELAKSDLSDRETSQILNRNSCSEITTVDHIRKESSSRDSLKDHNKKTSSKEPSEDSDRMEYGSNELSNEVIRRESQSMEYSFDGNRRSESKDTSLLNSKKISDSKESVERTKLESDIKAIFAKYNINEFSKKESSVEILCDKPDSRVHSQIVVNSNEKEADIKAVESKPIKSLEERLRDISSSSEVQIDSKKEKDVSTKPCTSRSKHNSGSKEEDLKRSGQFDEAEAKLKGSSQSAAAEAKSEAIGKRLENLASSETSRAEKRHKRQFHPYRKEEARALPSSSTPSWSFDVAYSDMHELLQNLTESQFLIQGKKPADVSQWKKIIGKRRKFRCSGSPRNTNATQGRFSKFEFTRAPLPKSPVHEDRSSEDENDNLSPDMIPDLEERQRKADIFEELFMGRAEEEDEEFDKEKTIYDTDTTGAPCDKRVVVCAETVPKGPVQVTVSINCADDCERIVSPPKKNNISHDKLMKEDSVLATDRNSSDKSKENSEIETYRDRSVAEVSTEDRSVAEVSTDTRKVKLIHELDNECFTKENQVIELPVKYDISKFTNQRRKDTEDPAVEVKVSVNEESLNQVSCNDNSSEQGVQSEEETDEDDACYIITDELSEELEPWDANMSEIEEIQLTDTESEPCYIVKSDLSGEYELPEKGIENTHVSELSTCQNSKDVNNNQKIVSSDTDIESQIREAVYNKSKYVQDSNQREKSRQSQTDHTQISSKGERSNLSRSDNAKVSSQNEDSEMTLNYNTQVSSQDEKSELSQRNHSQVFGQDEKPELSQTENTQASSQDEKSELSQRNHTQVFGQDKKPGLSQGDHTQVSSQDEKSELSQSDNTQTSNQDEKSELCQSDNTQASSQDEEKELSQSDNTQTSSQDEISELSQSDHIQVSSQDEISELSQTDNTQVSSQDKKSELSQSDNTQAPSQDEKSELSQTDKTHASCQDKELEISQIDLTEAFSQNTISEFSQNDNTQASSQDEKTELSQNDHTQTSGQDEISELSQSDHTQVSSQGEISEPSQTDKTHESSQYKKSELSQGNHTQASSQEEILELSQIDNTQSSSQDEKSELSQSDKTQAPSQDEKSELSQTDNTQAPSQDEKSELSQIDNTQAPSQDEKSELSQTDKTHAFCQDEKSELSQTDKTHASSQDKKSELSQSDNTQVFSQDEKSELSQKDHSQGSSQEEMSELIQSNHTQGSSQDKKPELSQSDHAQMHSPYEKLKELSRNDCTSFCSEKDNTENIVFTDLQNDYTQVSCQEKQNLCNGNYSQSGHIQLSGYTQNQDDDKHLSSQECDAGELCQKGYVVGALHKPHNYSLEQAAVTRFVKSTDNMQVTNQEEINLPTEKLIKKDLTQVICQSQVGKRSNIEDYRESDQTQLNNQEEKAGRTDNNTQITDQEEQMIQFYNELSQINDMQQSSLESREKTLDELSEKDTIHYEQRVEIGQSSQSNITKSLCQKELKETEDRLGESSSTQYPKQDVSDDKLSYNDITHFSDEDRKKMRTVKSRHEENEQFADKTDTLVVEEKLWESDKQPNSDKEQNLNTDILNQSDFVHRLQNVECCDNTQHPENEAQKCDTNDQCHVDTALTSSHKEEDEIPEKLCQGDINQHSKHTELELSLEKQTKRRDMQDQNVASEELDQEGNTNQKVYTQKFYQIDNKHLSSHKELKVYTDELPKRNDVQDSNLEEYCVVRTKEVSEIDTLSLSSFVLNSADQFSCRTFRSQNETYELNDTHADAGDALKSISSIRNEIEQHKPQSKQSYLDAESQTCDSDMMGKNKHSNKLVATNEPDNFQPFAQTTINMADCFEGLSAYGLYRQAEPYSSQQAVDTSHAESTHKHTNEYEFINENLCKTKTTEVIAEEVMSLSKEPIKLSPKSDGDENTGIPLGRSKLTNFQAEPSIGIVLESTSKIVSKLDNNAIDSGNVMISEIIKVLNYSENSVNISDKKSMQTLDHCTEATCFKEDQNSESKEHKSSSLTTGVSISPTSPNLNESQNRNDQNVSDISQSSPENRITSNTGTLCKLKTAEEAYVKLPQCTTDSDTFKLIEGQHHRSFKESESNKQECLDNMPKTSFGISQILSLSNLSAKTPFLDKYKLTYTPVRNSEESSCLFPDKTESSISNYPSHAEHGHITNISTNTDEVDNGLRSTMTKYSNPSSDTEIKKSKVVNIKYNSKPKISFHISSKCSKKSHLLYSKNSAVFDTTIDEPSDSQLTSDSKVSIPPVKTVAECEGKSVNKTAEKSQFLLDSEYSDITSSSDTDTEKVKLIKKEISENMKLILKKDKPDTNKPVDLTFSKESHFVANPTQSIPRDECNKVLSANEIHRLLEPDSTQNIALLSDCERMSDRDEQRGSHIGTKKSSKFKSSRKDMVKASPSYAKSPSSDNEQKLSRKSRGPKGSKTGNTQSTEKTDEPCKSDKVTDVYDGPAYSQATQSASPVLSRTLLSTPALLPIPATMSSPHYQQHFVPYQSGSPQSTFVPFPTIGSPHMWHNTNSTNYTPSPPPAHRPPSNMSSPYFPMGSPQYSSIWSPQYSPQGYLYPWQTFPQAPQFGYVPTGSQQPPPPVATPPPLSPATLPQSSTSHPYEFLQFYNQFLKNMAESQNKK